MADARSLPISAKHREFTVKVNGRAVPREHQLNAVRVSKQVNRIASARLVYLDGAPSSGKFPLSSSDLFAPGAEVEVLAGGPEDTQSLFRGLVIGQSLRIRAQSASLLTIECRHAAVKLSVGARSACFLELSDTEVIEKLLASAGLSGDVADTGGPHAHLVQYRTTSWEFLVARARANGLIVLTNGPKLEVKAPALDGKEAFNLTYGATLLELDAEIDAREQVAGVSAASWDPAQQAVSEREAQAPATDGLGNFSPGKLASAVASGTERLVHGALPEAEAERWAKAEYLRTRLDKVQGRAKCEGIALAEPGTRVKLDGVGARVSGSAFVTGVRHDFDTVQGWKTNLQFGGLGGAAAPAPARRELAPGVSGLQIGVVTDLEDPSGEHRVRVRVPLVDGSDGVWARIAAPDAGKERGFFFRPELEDEVVLGFIEDDPRAAVILGSLHSSAHAAPGKASDDNPIKLYQSREKLVLRFDDEKKAISLETPAGNKLLLDDQAKTITLADQNGNKLVMSSSGIELVSAAALKLKSATDLAVDGGTAFKATGAASAELSSSGTAVLKGSLVQIN